MNSCNRRCVGSNILRFFANKSHYRWLIPNQYRLAAPLCHRWSRAMLAESIPRSLDCSLLAPHRAVCPRQHCSDKNVDPHLWYSCAFAPFLLPRSSVHRWLWQRWVLDLYCIFAHCARSKVMTPVRYSIPLSCLHALERVLRRPRILMLTHLNLRIRDGIFIMAAESSRAIQLNFLIARSQCSCI